MVSEWVIVRDVVDHLNSSLVHLAFHLFTISHDGYLCSGDIMKPRAWMLSIEEQVVMGPHDGIINGIAAVLASYYNFNLQYPEDGACTLEFIQRYCNTEINNVLDCFQH